MLELRDVFLSPGREPVLSGASLQIFPDQPTAILGLGSPAQREALLRVLSGVERPKTGSIRLNGQDVRLLRREKGRIVRVDPHGVKPSRQRVARLVTREVAERVRLGGRLDSPVSALDLDQRMRLAIAIARSGKPSLILLDAPGELAEPDARSRFLSDLNPMLAGTGAAVVLVAATPEEARGLGGGVAVFHHGRLVQAGPAMEVFDHPANLAAALATSHPALNTLAMKASEGRGVLADGSSFQPPDWMTLPADSVCTLAFRPDDTAMERNGAPCVRFIVQVAGEKHVAGRQFVRVAFAGTNWLAPKLTAVPPVGMMLNIFVDRGRLMLFDAEGQAVA